MTNRLLVVFLSVLAFACVSAHSFRSGSGKVYAPTSPDSILIFYSEDDVKRPFETVGEISTEGSSAWGHGEGSLIKKARKKAAEMGAHAILVRPFDAPNNTKKVLAVLFGTNDNKQRMTAIRFTEQSPARTVATGLAGQQSAAVEASTARAAAPMTNEDVLKLVSAGLGEEFILIKIRASPTSFALDTDSIVRLKSAGVSERVLAAMLEGSRYQPHGGVSPEPLRAEQAQAESPTADEVGASTLLGLLQSDDRKVRERAVVDLGKPGPHANERVPALIVALRDPSWQVRLSATEALGRIGPDAHSAVPALLETTRDKNVATSIKAGRAIERIGPSALAALTEAAKSPDPKIRKEAANLAKKILESSAH
jgi:hypothetical protein